jgi:hypothetical protein
MLVTVIALDVRQTLDVGEPTARACLAHGYLHDSLKSLAGGKSPMEK